ncbi:PAS domain-containing protein [Candidatus Chloroploca sp. Khr17]|uniref:PAS domain-containing protein n=1 Tax=Candidatus Chloroploca sp. Khr17 TaxID=2496869 RepID=UPI00351792E6
MSVSVPDRRLLFASSRFAEVFGYPAEVFVTNAGFFKQIVHPDDLEASMHAMEQGLRDGFVELEHRIIWPDGQVRRLHRRAWVDVDAHDRPMAGRKPRRWVIRLTICSRPDGTTPRSAKQRRSWLRPDDGRASFSSVLLICPKMPPV